MVIISDNKKYRFKNSHNIKIHFGGIFQDRLATYSDLFNNLRGEQGWTMAHTGESDFD